MPADRPPHGPDQPGGDDHPHEGDDRGERADRPETPPERGRTRSSWRGFELADDEDTPTERHDDQPDQGPGRTEHGDADLGIPAATDETEQPATPDRFDELASSGWDDPTVRDNPDRPSPDEIHLSDKSRRHIADRHSSGAGHPNRTEFPSDWDEEKIMSTVFDVARNPDKTPAQQPDSGLWEVYGTRDEVTVLTVVRRDGLVITGYPLEGSPGVVRNPPKDQQ